MDPYESVSESNSPQDISEAEEKDEKPVKKKPFSITRFKFYYNSRMKGVGKRYLGLIACASAETHLTKEQVMDGMHNNDLS